MTDETMAHVRRIDWATQPQRYVLCRHHHICLVNAGHLLHPVTLDVCDLGAKADEGRP